MAKIAGLCPFPLFMIGIWTKKKKKLIYQNKQVFLKVYYKKIKKCSIPAGKAR